MVYTKFYCKDLVVSDDCTIKQLSAVCGAFGGLINVYLIIGIVDIGIQTWPNINCVSNKIFHTESRQRLQSLNGYSPDSFC